MSRTVQEINPRGGMETHGELLLTGLAARGIRIEVITTRHPDGLLSLEKNGVHYHFLADCATGAYSSTYFEKSTELLVERHTDQPFDAVLSQSGGAFGYVSRGRRRTLGVPVAYIMHGITPWELRSARAAVARWRDWINVFRLFLVLVRERLLPAHSNADVDAMLAVSEELACAIRIEWPHRKERVYTVVNGVDSELFRPDPEGGRSLRTTHGIGDEEVVVLMAGRLAREKGCHLALQALSRLAMKDSVRLVIAGTGPERERLERASRELGLSARVLFLGHVEWSLLPRWYAACDLFLLPTLRWEGLPMSVVEALSCGRPVIASRIGGVPSAVMDGVTGELIEAGDTEALTEALARMVADPRRRMEMGHAAREDAKSRLSQERMVEQTIEVLRRIVGKDA